MEKNSDQFPQLRLKPMTEGLGLNHFADGLPYTPTHAKRKPNVSFNYPPPRAPRPSPELEQAPVGTETARAMVEKFDAETAADSGAQDTANFVRRVLAYGIDILLASAMFVVIVWASFSLNGYDLGQLLSEPRGVQMFWPLALLYGVVYMGYFLIQETTWQRTLGKSLMNIRIRSSSGFATLGRSVCFFLAAVPLGIGLLWYFFDSRRRCWHDVITDCEVVSN